MLEFSDFKIVHYSCSLKILRFPFLFVFFILITKIYELIRLRYYFFGNIVSGSSVHGLKFVPAK